MCSSNFSTVGYLAERSSITGFRGFEGPGLVAGVELVVALFLANGASESDSVDACFSAGAIVES